MTTPKLSILYGGGPDEACLTAETLADGVELGYIVRTYYGWKLRFHRQESETEIDLGAFQRTLEAAQNGMPLDNVAALGMLRDASEFLAEIDGSYDKPLA